MRNKKKWLFIKAGFILFFTVIILGIPADDSMGKWIRFIMLTFFVVSFIIDLKNYKKGND